MTCWCTSGITDLGGIRVGGEALQHGLPWHGVIIVAQQEPPHAQAMRFSIGKDQLIMDLLRAVGFAKACQGHRNVFAGPKRKRLPH
jgi:hypothetical protein